jgi:hypothetical protein
MLVDVVCCVVEGIEVDGREFGLNLLGDVCRLWIQKGIELGTPRKKKKKKEKRKGKRLTSYWR